LYQLERPDNAPAKPIQREVAKILQVKKWLD